VLHTSSPQASNLKPHSEGICSTCNHEQDRTARRAESSRAVLECNLRRVTGTRRRRRRRRRRTRRTMRGACGASGLLPGTSKRLRKACVSQPELTIHRDNCCAVAWQRENAHGWSINHLHAGPPTTTRDRLLRAVEASSLRPVRTQTKTLQLGVHQKDNGECAIRRQFGCKPRGPPLRR